MWSDNLPVLMVEPHWSLQRGALAVIQVAVCLGIPWLIPVWAAGLKLGISALSLLLLAVSYQRLGWWGTRSMRKASWLPSGQWLLERRDGLGVPAELLGSSQANPYFVCLRFRADAARMGAQVTPHYWLMFIRGELNADVWRQLQARLRVAGAGNLPVDWAGQK